MAKIFPEILILCEVRKFQVHKQGPSESNILSTSKKSWKLIDFFEIERIFCSLGPVCGPGSWVIAKFSQLTQIEDFRNNFTHGEYLEKF